MALAEGGARIALRTGVEVNRPSGRGVQPPQAAAGGRHSRQAPVKSIELDVSSPVGSATEAVRRLCAGAANNDIEGWIREDLDSFWRWCPAPMDGLHRCALLVKLFDRCGLTKKEDKIWYKVRRLDQELFKMGVMETQQIEPHMRIPYEAITCKSFRDGLARSSEVKKAWDEKRRNAARAEQGPLAVWVLAVIALEDAPPAS